MTTLYSYWRSAAAYRVRIALNLKAVPYDLIPVHLVKGPDGVPEHRAAAYTAINPQRRVPALRTDTGDVLLQSPAILEWLEETHPNPPLLPSDPIGRARVRMVVSIICCDIHPLQNVSVLNQLRSRFGADDTQVQAWIAHWITEGLTAVEALVGDGPFAFGDRPTLADVCIVPQVYGARRFGVSLTNFTRIEAIDARMQGIDAVKSAHPSVQIDAE